MPGYLIDEGGERTHAVVPVEEYERLRRAAENLETVRGYASEIMAVIERENPVASASSTGPARQAAPTEEMSQAAPEQTSATNDTEKTSDEGSGEGRTRGYGWQA